MRRIFIILITIFSIFSCTNHDCGCVAPPPSSSVLILKVDYTTNNFEAGKQFFFPQTNTFTIQTDYKAPSDFGWIKLNYQEINQPLFDGTIVWNGLGHALFPSDFETANSFDTSAVVPNNIPIFENVFNPQNTVYNYSNAWNSVANLGIVNYYRTINPNGTAKIFLYTPSVGVGNPADWKWIIILQK